MAKTEVSKRYNVYVRFAGGRGLQLPSGNHLAQSFSADSIDEVIDAYKKRGGILFPAWGSDGSFFVPSDKIDSIEFQDMEAYRAS